MSDYRTYGVSAHDRKPLIDFMLGALRASGCSIIHEPSPDQAPFRFSFETPSGERMGVVAYAFLATFTPTLNRPDDEHSFQIKYGSKRYGEPAGLHELWQDPNGLYTTICCGINPEQGFFVGIDPELHNPTKFFIRVEFKQGHVHEILARGWHAWERDVRRGLDEPVEVLVGGTAQSFLRYIRFERAALREDQGHRQLLAEWIGEAPAGGLIAPVRPVVAAPAWSAAPTLHALAHEFEMPESEVLDLIASAHRLKMAVRGWVAEAKLVQELARVPGVTDCVRIDEEGGPDVSLRYSGVPLTVECKNVLRKTTASGIARVDFQRTRASLGDPCSRYYQPSDFDVIAACLHSITNRWEFHFVLPRALEPHKSCPGRLSNRLLVDGRFSATPESVLSEAVRPWSAVT